MSEAAQVVAVIIEGAIVIAAIAGLCIYAITLDQREERRKRERGKL